MADYTQPYQYWGVSPQTAGTFPLGLRTSNNLFNIKYYPGAERNQQKWPGLIGPSTARDQGDPQMLFANPDDSGVAGAQLLRRKYDSGMRTPQQIIAGQNGWTPGRMDSANAVAGYAGVQPNADLKLDTPEGMRRFLPALATQEHGTWARDKLFTDDMFDRIAERATGAQFASGDLPKLEQLKDDGSNAHRWANGPQKPVMQPPPTNAPAAPPQGPQPMAMTPQPQPEESPFNQFINRFQSPMTQQGLGLLMSAMQGGDLNQGMTAGAQRGQMALQQQLQQQQQREAQAKKQALAQMLSDPSAMQGVPAPLVNLARATGDVDPVSQFLVKSSQPPTSDDIKEYEYAKKGGFTGSFVEWMAQKKSQGGHYGLQPVWGTDDKGNRIAYQMSNQGGMQPLKLPEGVKWENGVEKLDVGTHFVLIDKKSGAPIPGGVIPKNVAEREVQEKIGQARGQAQVDLPRVQSQSAQVYKYIDAVINDKNLPNVLGWAANAPTIFPGSHATEERLKQLQGRAFEQAFQGMKGAGAITEQEGAAATAALARLKNLKQDHPSYLAALEDFRNEIKLLVTLAEQKARMGLGPQQQPQPAPGAPQPAPAGNGGWGPAQKVQ